MAETPGGLMYRASSLFCSPKRLRAALAAGADPNSTDGWRAIDAPVPMPAAFHTMRAGPSRKGVECLRLLLEAGADPNARNWEGISLLEYARRAKWRGCGDEYAACAALLVRFGAIEAPRGPHSAPPAP